MTWEQFDRYARGHTKAVFLTFKAPPGAVSANDDELMVDTYDEDAVNGVVTNGDSEQQWFILSAAQRPPRSRSGSFSIQGR